MQSLPLNTITGQTAGRRDGRTELPYQYRAVSMRDKMVESASQCGDEICICRLLWLIAWLPELYRHSFRNVEYFV